MDVSGKSVVILGDSHVDGSTFGLALERLLREKGAEVTRFGWGGSAARTWLAGKPIFGKQYTLAQVNASGPYDFALICLGTNDGANAQRAALEGGPSLASGTATAARQILQVADGLSAKKVIWIGPPAMGTANPYYTNAAMDAVWAAGAPLFGGRAIDSRGATREHVGGDGIHFGKTGGTAWAQFVVDALSAQQAGAGAFSVPALAAGALAAVLVAVAVRVRMTR